jgi:hypothetical protein
MIYWLHSVGTPRLSALVKPHFMSQSLRNFGLKASLGRARPVEAQIVEHPLKVEKRSGLAPRALPGVKTRGQVTRGLPHAGPVKPVARKRCGAS